MAAKQAVSCGHPKRGEEKLILRSEKVRFIHVLLMLFLRRPITSYAFVEVGDRTAADIGSTPGDCLVALIQLIQKVLAAAYYPALVIGAVVEFLLNFVALNNGILGIVVNIFRCKLVIPLNREAPNFRSIVRLIDGRMELQPLSAGSGPQDDRHLQVVGVSGAATGMFTSDHNYYVDVERGGTTVAVPLRRNHVNGRLIRLRAFSVFEVSMMASKIAYENAAYIENVVNNIWKFHFVGFYNCWNKFLGDHTTQAFVFTDNASDASVVMVSFRGTQVFNTRDWSTDVDLSWLGMGVLGHVHVGFLKALGLQSEDGKDAAKAFPKDAPEAIAGEPVAYYTLRKTLREPVELLRLVYRYDVVPRVLFDAPPVAEFAHGGTCFYFEGWYKGRVIEAGGDAPNPNYFDPRYLLSMYGNAWGDLFKGAFLWTKEGKDYCEGAASLLYRTTGLLVPSIASHSPRDYLNAVRLGSATAGKDEE